MQDFGKLLVIIGLVIATPGALPWKTGGLGGLGKLSGDMFIQKGNSNFYFPIFTCLLISAVTPKLACKSHNPEVELDRVLPTDSGRPQIFSEGHLWSS